MIYIAIGVLYFIVGAILAKVFYSITDFERTEATDIAHLILLFWPVVITLLLVQVIVIIITGILILLTDYIAKLFSPLFNFLLFIR